MRSRSLVRLHVVLQVLLATWILWIGNAWAFRHSWRVDLTRDQLYTIAPETREFLRRLPKRVDVVIPYSLGPSAVDRVRAQVLRRVVRTLEEFELVNPYCRLSEYVNVGRQPIRWQSLREERGLDQPNQVYIFAGDRREVVSIEEMAVIRSGRDGPVLERESVPEALAAALQRVVGSEPRNVVFTFGHGETSVEDSRRDLGMAGFVRDLRARGNEISTVDLAGGGAISPATSLLVVVGGRAGGERFQPFGPDAVAEVERFVSGGGKILLLLPFDGASGLEPMLSSLGIVVQPGLVNSPVRTAGDGMGVIRAERFDETHPITSRFRFGEDIVELNSTRALQLSGGVTPLVLSGPDSWRELVLDGNRAEGEPLGPFPVVAAAEGRGRVVVLGSWTPALDVFYRGRTRRLLLNSCDWLTDREGVAAGAGRVDTGDRVLVTPGVRRAFFWTGLVSLPGSILLLGAVVWFVRRRSS